MEIFELTITSAKIIRKTNLLICLNEQNNLLICINEQNNLLILANEQNNLLQLTLMLMNK